MRLASIVALALVSAVGPVGNAQESRGALARELGDLFAEQRYEDLLRRVEPSLDDRPETAALWMMAAEAALKLEDYRRSIECFERALKLSPALEAAAINLAFAYLKVDRPDDAERVLKRFIEDSSRKHAAKAHYGIGLVFLARGDPAKAKDAFLKSVKLDPDDVRAHYRLGQLAVQAADWQTALTCFNRVLEKDDLHHGAAYGVARAHSGLGAQEAADEAATRHRSILEVSDALPAMVRKLGAATDPVAARLAISDRLQAAGAAKSAMVWFLRARKLDPSHPDIRRRLPGQESRPESRR